MSTSFLYVCDLDGTLLASDGSLSDKSRRGLNQLLAEDALITIASARGTPAMRALLEGVALSLPVMELCGAFISELDTGQHLAGHLLDPEVAHAVIELILETGFDPVLSAWDGAQDRVYFGPRKNDGTRWYVDEKRQYGDPRLTACDCLVDAARGSRVAAVTGFVPDNDAGALIARIQSLVGRFATVQGGQNGYCPGWTEVLVQDKWAEKGAALPTLLAACGIADAEIVACGDHLVDLGIFASASISIAPENAHPAILEAATEVVASNDADGIVDWMLDHHAAFGRR